MMKNRKFLKSLIALPCVFTLGLGAITGCGGDSSNGGSNCEHVYTWTVHEGDESTCTKQGTNTGVCGICGDIKEDKMPIDANAHAYTGEWQITKPTEEAEGLAVKTCANNPEHKTQVVLPKLTITGSGYDEKEFITVPTTVREGEMKLTLKNTYGDITFNATLAKRKLNNMDDAVTLASSLKENVRSVTGWFKQAVDEAEQKFSYYFGDDYTYIDEEVNGIESWYSLDEDGNVFAMSKKYDSSTAFVVSNPEKEMLNGFHYNSTVPLSTFYGAEQGLAQLYETAMTGLVGGTTVNYQQIDEIKSERDGSLKDIWFSFSYDSGNWFARFYVKFSTYDDGTLKELTVQTEIIRPFMYAQDEAGSAIFYKETDASVVSGQALAGDIVFGYIYPDLPGGGNDYETYIDEDEKVRYVYEQEDAEGNLIYEKHVGSGLEYYIVTYEKQDSGDYATNYKKLDGKPEGLKYVYAKDVFGNTVYDKNGEPLKKIMARNCVRVEEFYSDQHEHVSYRTANFTQTRKVTQAEIDAGLKEPEVVPPNPYPSDNRYIKDFDITGASTGGNVIDISEGLILPTNKSVQLSLGNITPASATLNTDAISTIYVEDATGARIKLNFDFSNGSQYRILSFFTASTGKITINSQYAGDVKFVFVTESGKCEKEVTITFEKSAPTSLSAVANVYTVIDGVASDKESSVSIDKPVNLIVGQSLRFWAITGSSEAAYASTDIYPVSTAGLTFSQPEEGNYREWELVADTPGEYIVKMPYYDGTTSSAEVYARFKVIVTEGKSVMEKLSGNTFEGKVLIAQATGNPRERAITAEFTVDGKINITVASNQIVYTYGVDEGGNLVTSWESGLAPTTKSYDFEFSINEAGDLVITHGTGMGNNKEDKVLTLVSAS